ncbi:MAG: NIPSNAP family protein [Gemmataceae bacterium]
MDTRVFELRTYTAAPGKLEELLARFRERTVKLFEKHHMTLIGFWTPSDAQQAKRQLVYLLAFPNHDAATKSWKEFNATPEWHSLREVSEKHGPLVENIDSVFLKPTDFSPLR